MENQVAKTTLDRITFTEEQVELIKSQIAPNAKPQELALFLYQCKRTGLDPMARQIYCIHRGGKMGIQTSIDGFRVVAERSGDYAGQDEPIWEENERGIVKCSVAVYRFAPNGQRYRAAVGVAFFSEYCAGGPMWQKMPHTMIAKCAEALALRKAYPQDLSGLYTGDEMEQVDNQPAQTQEAQEVHAEVVPDVEQWKDAVTQCPDKTALGALYKQNKSVVDSNPDIKNLFTERKLQLAA